MKKIEDYRLSDLGAEKVEKLITEKKCTLFIVEKNEFGDVTIATKNNVSICGTFMRGKCIVYDGLPSVSLNEVKDCNWYFICEKGESKELYDSIKLWISIYNV